MASYTCDKSFVTDSVTPMKHLSFSSGVSPDTMKTFKGQLVDQGERGMN